MNKSSLYTSAKSFDGNKNLYLMSVFDLEPSGIIVHVYDQLHSKEYMLPVSEMEVKIGLITTMFYHRLDFHFNWN